MILNGGKYIGSANRDRGTCTNGKIIAATTVERRVLTGVKTHLISPEAIALAVTRYQEAADEHRRMIERACADGEGAGRDPAAASNGPRSCSWKRSSTWTP
jgi:hypothetical protein